MRILIAPNPDTIPLHTWPAGDGRFEVLQLANEKPTYDRPRPGNAWKDLLARCPSGWKPDVFICWSFEYRPIPEGIEEADCLTVGVVGDWNLGGQAILEMGSAFDLLVADRNGCERLSALGFENVLYHPLWGYDPARHYRISAVERDLDVVMVGNFNHDIQRERAPWLARVARLSRRHRVLVASGIYGEEYTRTLNRAKIVFNRSIRGELNMRVYEAAACGALMFYERENREIGELLSDREECVLYGDDDLEELIDYYLKNDSERLRIAEAGARRIAAFTYAEQAAGLFTKIERCISMKKSRSLARLTADERRLRRVRQWLTVAPTADLHRAAELLDEVCDAETDPSMRYAAKACLLGEQARRNGDLIGRSHMLRDALDISRWNVRLDAHAVTARINRAEVALDAGEVAIAESEFKTAFANLDHPDLSARQLMGPHYPRAFDAFTVEIEQLYSRGDAWTKTWLDDFADLLRWRCHSRVAEIALGSNHPEMAVSHAEDAVSLKPDLGPTWLLLARAHRAFGQLPEAITAYRRAYELTPLLAEIWPELLETYAAIGAECELHGFAEDLLSIIDGCPNFEHLRGTVERASRHRSEPIAALLATPDWTTAQNWQPILTEFTRVFRYEPDATLALIVDPRACADVNALSTQIERFLTHEVGIPESDWADIHLIHQSMESLEITAGTSSIGAVLPPPWGPGADWHPNVPRMNVSSFHHAFIERRSPVLSKAA